MRPSDSGQWINHMLDPKAMIRCSMGHIAPPEQLFKHYQYIGTDGIIEDWTLSIYHYFTTDFSDGQEEKALKLLDRAWRWYRSYLEWDDKNIDIDDYAKDN